MDEILIWCIYIYILINKSNKIIWLLFKINFQYKTMDPKIFGLVSIPVLIMSGVITTLTHFKGSTTKSEQFVKKNDNNDLINWIFCMLK